MSIKTDLYEQDGQSGPDNIVKQDPTEDDIDDILKFAGSEVGFLDSVLDKEVLAKHSSSREWEWEHFQYDYFDETKNFISNKARRVGLSTAGAAKAFARGILANDTDYEAIFVSHRMEDAQQKIDYVRNFLEALPPRFEKNVIRDPLQLIQWENNNHTTTKIISHPQKAVRGEDGDILLDEFAHYQYDKKIYTSAYNSIAMGDYSIDIISTPFGKSGMFYDIMSNPEQYPSFVRKEIFWWQCKRYLTTDHDHSQDVAVAWADKIIQENPLYRDNIEERVNKFGNESLKGLFRNQRESSFRQELEAHFIDEEASFFSKDLIRSCMFMTGNDSIDNYNPIESDFDDDPEKVLKRDKWPIEEKYSDKEIDFRIYSGTDEHDYPSQLYSAVKDRKINGKLVAGVDIGTSRNATELVILEEIRVGDKTLQIERFRLSRSDWKLPRQQNYFENLLNHGYVRKLRMDTNGLGTQLGQYLEEKFDNDRFEAVCLNSANKKDREMTNLIHRFKQKSLALSFDTSKVTQLHLINRVETKAGNVTYRAAERNGQHADYAWALGLASLAGTPVGMSQVNTVDHDISEFSVSKDDDYNSPASAPFVNNFNEQLNKEVGDTIAGPNPLEEDIAKAMDDPGEFIDF